MLGEGKGLRFGNLLVLSKYQTKTEYMLQIELIDYAVKYWEIPLN